MIKIVFVLPYASLASNVEKSFQELHRTDIDYKMLTVENSEEELVDQLQGDVIIARGFASHFFESRKPENMLNVEIATTGADIILATDTCIQKYHKNHIAILGTKSIIDSSHHLEKLFIGTHFDYYLTEQRTNVLEIIKKASANGAEVLIGGQTVCLLASQLNIPSTLILTGPEAIIKSLDIAIRLVEETRKEREERDRIAKIMQYSYGGILSTDSNGIIQSINRNACNIFHAIENELIGKPFSKLLPTPDILPLIAENRTLKDEICKIQGRLLTLNCIPIAGEKGNTGAVITCLEASELQKTEAKLRKKILDRGFIAKYHFDDIVHHDLFMEHVIEKAQRFSQNESNIFIHGETGVGKELFAQSIHNASRRKNAPFVAINCAALPEQLLESELFGYVEGAFTGASKSGKIGMFEAAHHGTIFLDEIGDMSLNLQGRLLRVLQEGEIVRLGDDHVIPIDVRVISATNRNLNTESELGNFRTDLMYRLDVLKIEIPPLRDRKQDIIPLSLCFIESICQREGKTPFRAIEISAQKMLEDFPWKGNVRQLHNTIQRICVLCERDTITSEIVVEALELKTPTIKAFDIFPFKDKSQEKESEKEIILRALQENQYNKGKTAKQLHINRSTLWRKIKKHQIS